MLVNRAQRSWSRGFSRAFPPKGSTPTHRPTRDEALGQVSQPFFRGGGSFRCRGDVTVIAESGHLPLNLRQRSLGVLPHAGIFWPIRQAVQVEETQMTAADFAAGPGCPAALGPRNDSVSAAEHA